MAEPSKVIHFRNVASDVTENELLALAQNFGVVTRVVHIRSKNQALLQMQDITAAASMVQYYSEAVPSIRGSRLYMQFSSHQELTNHGEQQGGGGLAAPRRMPDQEAQPNRILLVTIHNPLYPINVDVLQQVFSPHGFVEKIVTFSKSSGLQALLQYSSQQSAIQARSTLQGRNIYDGCCTLDIQFSNLTELQVNFNNDRTRDYTNSQLPEAGNGRGPPPAANASVMSSLFGDGGNVYGGMHHPGPRQAGGFQQSGPPPPGLNPYQVPSVNPIVAALGGSLPPGVTGTNDRPTVLISNLNTEEVDADKLFNLFSNYGNVVRIKTLHNKPDHALVEMADPFQAELAVTYLKGISILGKRAEVNFSKHSHINPSPDTKDFSSSPLNRFNRNALKNYRHCCPPTKMIHCSSLPPDATTESVTEFLSPHGSIQGAKVYEKEGKKQALVLFSAVEEATSALVCKHASSMHGATIRLAFSKNASL